MTLDDLISSQRASQVQRGHDPAAFTDEERIDYIRVQVLGALDEVHEVLAETCWKPWRTQGYGEINREQYLAELADVHIFLANLVVAVGGTGQELDAAIRKVQEKNEARQRDGY